MSYLLIKIIGINWYVICLRTLFVCTYIQKLNYHRFRSNVYHLLVENPLKL